MMTEIELKNLSPSDLLTTTMKLQGAPLPWCANVDAEIWSADGRLRVIRVSDDLPSRVQIAKAIARSINSKAGYGDTLTGENVISLKRA